MPARQQKDQQGAKIKRHQKTQFEWKLDGENNSRGGGVGRRGKPAYSKFRLRKRKQLALRRRD